MRLVDELKQGLIASHGARQAAEELGVAIEVSVGARNPHVGDRHPEPIEGAAGDKTNEADAAVEIKVDQVSIGWTAIRLKAVTPGNDAETPFPVTDGGR